MLALLKQVTQPVTPVAEQRAAAPGAAQHQLRRIERGLKLLTVPLPYLAGLAATVRVIARRPRADDGRVRVGAAGRQSRRSRRRSRTDELIFVLAHELLHLALRTHDRARGSQHLEFNYAHDYIINDILRTELGVEHVPAGGLDMPGASKRSAEEIVLEMRRNARDHAVEDRGLRRTGDDGRARVRPARARPAGEQAGRQPTPATCSDAQQEKEMFPDDVAAQAEAGRRDQGSGVRRARAGARGRCAQGPARRRPRRDVAGRHGAARHLPDTVGSHRCSGGWNRSRRASARSSAPRAAAPIDPMSCCQAGVAKAGC